jgi:hypothetical protein
MIVAMTFVMGADAEAVFPCPMMSSRMFVGVIARWKENAV